MDTYSREISVNSLCEFPSSTELIDNHKIQELIKTYSRSNYNSDFSISKVNRVQVVNPFLKKSFNFTVELTIKNGKKKRVEGNAEGNDVYLTILKAFSEAYERCVLSVRGAGFESSNGFASHVDLRKACMNSFYELVERDAILTSWYQKRKLLARIIVDDDSIAKLKLHKYGYDVNFYRIDPGLNKTENIFVIICIIKPYEQAFLSRIFLRNKFEGRLCGFGCSFSLNEAIHKAYREAALNAWVVFLEPSLLNTIGSEKNRFHITHYLKGENSAAFGFIENAEVSSLEHLLSSTIEVSIHDEMCAVKLFANENKLDLKWFLLADRERGDPFFVTKAVSPYLQELWFGNTPQNINQSRLGSVDEIMRIQKWPHPIA